jgi:pimeloyl-ACP methyl ester carboxylesterase
VAPDLPGFGFTEVSEKTRFTYTFDNLARVIESFTDAVGMERYAIYVFDRTVSLNFTAVRHRLV